MKCSELLRLLRLLRKDGWYPVTKKGSHIKLRNSTKSGNIIFPNHGSQVVGKGLEKRIKKQAGLK